MNTCPNCKRTHLNHHDGHNFCWDCEHEWDDPLPPQLTGKERIIRILEDGWLIYGEDLNTPHPKIICQIDEREDEVLPTSLIMDMLLMGELCVYKTIIQTYTEGFTHEREVTCFDLFTTEDCEITLTFQSEAEKLYFLHQLSDGWGESFVQLNWDKDEPFDNCQDFSVINTDPFRPERKLSYWGPHQ